MGTTTRNFRRSIRLNITDLLKSILKGITEVLQPPVREINNYYD